jgi:hypothetical protein
MSARIYTSKLRSLNIKNNDLDAPLSQQLYYTPPNTITTTRHNNNLLIPIIAVRDPIVADSLVEEVLDSEGSTCVEKAPEPFGEGRIGLGDLTAALGVEGS